MKTSNRYGFSVSDSFTYSGQVKSVSDNEVRFSINNLCGENYTGTYYVPKPSQMNPHKVFKAGDFWKVTIIKITKRKRYKNGYSFPETLIELEPQNLPTDVYIAEHPIGSTVAGKVITEVKRGKQLLISLGKNVYCCIKRDYHLAHGADINCRLTGYNNRKKTISAVLV